MQKCVVLTAGTFLDGVIHMGDKTFSAGRAGDKASIELEKHFKDSGFNIERLKTGTPPRIKTESVNITMLERQDSDAPLPMLSYLMINMILLLIKLAKYLAT